MSGPRKEDYEALLTVRDGISARLRLEVLDRKLRNLIELWKQRGIADYRVCGYVYDHCIRDLQDLLDG
jgi:hypothetical protein